jgi:hypothetical protein
VTDSSGGGDRAIARIEAQHYFAEADEIPAALIFRFDFHRHRLISHGRHFRSARLETMDSLPGCGPD